MFLSVDAAPEPPIAAPAPVIITPPLGRESVGPVAGAGESAGAGVLSATIWADDADAAGAPRFIKRQAEGTPEHHVIPLAQGSVGPTSPAAPDRQAPTGNDVPPVATVTADAAGMLATAPGNGGANGSTSTSAPDLAVMQRVNWVSAIPIGITQLTPDAPHSYNGPYFNNQTLYFNWIVLNTGDATAANYTVRLEVTGGGGQTFEWGPVTSAPGEGAWLSLDGAVGPLSAGTHAFRLWVDHGNAVTESDESDNFFERTITVLAAEDAYEENDTMPAVAARPAGAANSPNLGAVGPVTAIDNLAMLDGADWFRFETTATGARGDFLRIRFNHLQGDLDLALYDEAGHYIASSQQVQHQEAIDLQGLPPGAYFAQVIGFGGATNPQYDLRIQTQTPDNRLLSAPFTTDAQQEVRYVLAGQTSTGTVNLGMGLNRAFVQYPSGGAVPFEVVFDITRVGSMSDQEEVHYDQMGNVAWQTDALGQAVSYQFDGLGRLRGFAGPGTLDFASYAYDGNGNVVSQTDLTGETNYTYDALDRLTQIMFSGGDAISYSYDAAGRVASLTYPDDTLVSYTYDAAGRMATVTQGDDVTTYSYYPDGLLHTAELPNGITATYTYDDYARLASLAYTKPAGAIVTGFVYTTDDNGNRTQVEVRRANSGTPDLADYFSNIYRYGYDAQDRLTHAEYPDGQVVDYTYDANGNRLSLTSDPDGPAGPQPASVQNYHYGYDNRLESITGAGGAVLKELFYDPRGNLVMVVTPNDTTRYEYDFRNMLTGVETGTTRLEYLYDANGDRVARSENGEWTSYYNDPNRQQTQVLLEVDETGSVEANYAYGLGRISGVVPGETDPVYYLADALGSTSDLTGSAGGVVQSYSYDAFGGLRPNDAGAVIGASANEFTFAGERFDPAASLLYLRARATTTQRAADSSRKTLLDLLTGRISMRTSRTTR